MSLARALLFAAVTTLAVAGAQAEAKGSEPTSFALGDDLVWVAHGDGFVLRFDARTGRQFGRPIRVGYYPSDVVLTRTAAWIANFGSGGDEYAARNGTVTRIDRATGRVVATIRLPGVSPTRLAVAARRVWVIGADDPRLFAIEVATNRVSRAVRLHPTLVPWAVAAGNRRVTVSLTLRARRCAMSAACRRASMNGHVVAVDPITGETTRPVKVGRGRNEIAMGRGVAWITNPAEHTVTRLLAVRGRALGTIDLGSEPRAIAVGRAGAWVSVSSGSRSRVIRIDIRSPRLRPLASQRAIDADVRHLAVSDKHVWALSSAGFLIRLDALTGSENFRVRVGVR